MFYYFTFFPMYVDFKTEHDDEVGITL
jgi:hypothetical protein